MLLLRLLLRVKSDDGRRWLAALLLLLPVVRRRSHDGRRDDVTGGRGDARGETGKAMHGVRQRKVVERDGEGRGQRRMTPVVSGALCALYACATWLH